MHFGTTVIVLLLALAACGSANHAGQQEPARQDIPATGAATHDATQTVATADDGTGLGVIYYEKGTRAECKRRSRPGSRIHRLSCDTDEPQGAWSGGLGANAESRMAVPEDQHRVGK